MFWFALLLLPTAHCRGVGGAVEAVAAGLRMARQVHDSGRAGQRSPMPGPTPAGSTPPLASPLQTPPAVPLAARVSKYTEPQHTALPAPNLSTTRLCWNTHKTLVHTQLATHSRYKTPMAQTQCVPVATSKKRSHVRAPRQVSCRRAHRPSQVLTTPRLDPPSSQSGFREHMQPPRYEPIGCRGIGRRSYPVFVFYS